MPLTCRSAILLVPLAFAAPPTLAEDIVVRAAAGTSPGAERLLAQVAEPLRVTVPSGVDPALVVREMCGRVTVTFAALLSEANGELKTRPTEQTIVIPPCFVVRPRAETGILPGESLAQLAERTVGIAGPKTLASIVDANPQLKKAAEYQSWAVSDVLGGDAVVQIPFATSPTVYRLRPGYVGQAEVVLDMLRRELRGDAEGNEIAGGLRLESDIPAGAMLPAECPAAANPLANWPFDRAAVIEALARNAALRAQAGMPTVPAVTLAVADNGIDGLGSSFPTELLAINPGEVPGDGVDNEPNGYADDVSGVNVMTNTAPSPFPVKDSWHGTHVSRLALGPVAGAGAETPLRIRLLPISMVQKQVIGGLATGNMVRFSMPTEAVDRAFDYARSRKAAVLNLSVSTSEELAMLKSKLTGERALLIVAAAGNLATDFEADIRYPAGFAGSTNGVFTLPILSVGAHDRRGCLAAFSGRGITGVDLAAPGVGIESIDIGGGRRVADGTSQATAIVSFAAALLAAEGLENPVAIKARLIASVDPKMALQPHVFSGGLLNIPKALSLYEDVVVTRDGRTLRTRLVQRPSPKDICPARSADGKVLKIYAASPETLRLLVRWNRTDAFRYLDCAMPEGGIGFTEAGVEHRVAYRDIEDIVFRN